jgi:hypothetical protein
MEGLGEAAFEGWEVEGDRRHSSDAGDCGQRDFAASVRASRAKRDRSELWWATREAASAAARTRSSTMDADVWPRAARFDGGSEARQEREADSTGRLTFDMRGGRQQAKPDVGRPLDGRVRAQLESSQVQPFE